MRATELQVYFQRKATNYKLHAAYICVYTTIRCHVDDLKLFIACLQFILTSSGDYAH